jgi:hypothetical protein
LVAIRRDRTSDFSMTARQFWDPPFVTARQIW